MPKLWQKYVTGIFRLALLIKVERDFRSHQAADAKTVDLYNSGQGTEGPNAKDIRFDMQAGKIQSPWNHKCAILLLKNTKIPVPTPRLSDEEYIQLILEKLVRLKVHYNEAQPKNVEGVRETEDDIQGRLDEKDDRSGKIARATQRRNAVSFKRSTIICINVY